MWNPRLFPAKGTRSCATKLPAGLQVWISVSSPLWLIAMKSRPSPNLKRSQWLWQTQSIRTVSARRKECDEKKCWCGPGADRATDLLQMCLSKATDEQDFNIWKESSRGHYRARSNAEKTSLGAQNTQACMGVPARQKVHTPPVAHNCVHRHFCIISTGSYRRSTLDPFN